MDREEPFEMTSAPAPLAAPAAGRSSRTLSDHVFRELHERLIKGQFRPGERLRLETLRDLFNVGFSPLREALMRLSAEGLVRVEGQKGFRAAPVSIEDLRDVMSTRIKIEKLALADSLVAGDDRWEGALVAAFHRLSKLRPVEPGSNSLSAEWSRCHLDFHFALIAACRSHYVKRFWQTCYDQADRYRCLALLHSGVVRDDLSEHRGLMEAALNRDVVTACRLSRIHIKGTQAIVEEYFRSAVVQAPKERRGSAAA